MRLRCAPNRSICSKTSNGPIHQDKSHLHGTAAPIRKIQRPTFIDPGPPLDFAMLIRNLMLICPSSSQNDLFFEDG